MTTNLLIGFPELPFSYVSSIGIRGNSSADKNSLIMGARTKTAQLDAAQEEPWESHYPLSSGRTANFLAILRADLLKAQGVGSIALTGGSMPPNTPATISNLQLWLDAGYTVTVADSEKRISAWTDRSANAYSAAQGTAANQPTFSRADNRENLLSYSADCSNAAWVKHHSTCSSNAAANPLDFDTTADKIVENTDTSEHAVYQVQYVAAGQAYRASVMVRAGERTSIGFFVDGGGIGTIGVVANLTTGAITTSFGSPSNSTITALTSTGWYLISFEFTPATSGSPNFYINMRNGGGSANYTGDGASGFYIYGGQLSRSGASTKFADTQLMQRRRGMNGKNALYFDRDYTHYLSLATFTNLAITGDISIFGVVRHDGNATDSIRILHSSSGANGYTLSIFNQKLRFESNGVTVTGSTTLSPQTSYVVGVIKSGGTATLYVNDTSDGSGVVGACGAATLFRISDSASPFFGDIGELVVYSAAITAGERSNLFAYFRDRWQQAIGSNLDIQGTTLQGPREEDLLISFTTSASNPYYQVCIGANGDAISYTHSKEIFGQSLDLGRDPEWSRVATAQIETPAQRRKALKFVLNWKGLTMAKVLEFESSLNRYSAEMGVILYATSYTATLLGQSMIHCRILDYSVTPRPQRMADMTVTFEEVIA